MAKAKHYSPRIGRDLVSRLYHEAKVRNIPMMVFNEPSRESRTGSRG